MTYARTGVASAVVAYLLWGLFPIYWKWLQHLPALQLVAHRILWTCLTLGLLILLSGRRAALMVAMRQRGVVGLYLVAAALMGINWLVFLLAVDAGRVTETGLGYFISPLVNVLMGVLLLHEKLRRWQWVAVGLAATGVAYLVLMLASLPWMALTLAFAFGTYGLIKKRAALGAAEGLMLETLLLLPVAVGYLAYCGATGSGVFLAAGATAQWLIVGSGLVSMLPLLLFASASQRIPLSRLGFLQYITPTMQFLLGVLLYREPFGPHAMIGYGMVWVALAIFILEDASIFRRT